MAPTVRIRDIARAAGVSIGPVSRALKNQPGISDATRIRHQPVLLLRPALGRDERGGFMATRHMRVAIEAPGRSGVDLLVQGSPDARHLTLPVSLVVRSGCGARDRRPAPSAGG
jgi:hypothetical protein